MQFKDKVVVVTGGAHGIGQAIVEDFIKEGAFVEVIDKAEGHHYVGDIADKETLEAFSSYVLEKHSHIDYLINNALPIMKGIDECSYEEFQYALSVGVTAPFYLTKLFKEHFNKDAVIVNISFSRDRMRKLYCCKRRYSSPYTRSHDESKRSCKSQFYFTRMD